MPDGRTHAAATLALAACAGACSLLDPRALPVTAGILTGLILDPDLDIDGWTGSERRVWRLWRPLGWAWRVYWYPYARLARHRGISHWLVAGTLIRVVYLFAPPLALALWRGWPVPWGLAGLWLAGLCLADALHIGLDRLVTHLWRRECSTR
jgi:uncharacterized metal-binding protein